jgi:SOS-response transcriptional repressor LexA
MLASGHKKGTESTRREIAKTLGYSYDKFLYLGKQLAEGKNINLREFAYSIVIDSPSTIGYTDAAADIEPVRLPVYSSRNLKIINGLPMGKVIDYISQLPTTQNSKAAFGVRIGEDNMAPYLLPGMIVVIDPEAALEHGKLCFCGDENRVFRYYKYDDLIVLKSDSPSAKYPDMEFSSGATPPLYRVVESIRKE